MVDLLNALSAFADKHPDGAVFIGLLVLALFGIAAAAVVEIAKAVFVRRK